MLGQFTPVVNDDGTIRIPTNFFTTNLHAGTNIVLEGDTNKGATISLDWASTTQECATIEYAQSLLSLAGSHFYFYGSVATNAGFQPYVVPGVMFMPPRSHCGTPEGFTLCTKISLE